MPEWSAFGAWRHVTAFAFARIAEPGGYDGDSRFVVELFTRQLQPEAESVAGGIIPRDARVVDLNAGRLADDEQSRGS